MRAMSLMLSVWWVVAVMAAEPPAPNPDQPVDYVAWLNAGFGAKVKDNAAELYRQAANMSEEIGKARDELGVLPEMKKWGAAERETVHKCVDRNAKALDTLCAAAQKADCYFELKGETGALIDVVLPDAARIRGAAALLSYRARLRLVEGQVADAVDDVVCLLRIRRHLQTQPMLIQYLVAAAIDEHAIEILAVLPGTASRGVDLAGVLARLREADATPRTCVRQMIVEKLFVLDLVQRRLKDTDHDGKYDTLTQPDVLTAKSEPKKLEPPQSLEELVRDINACYGQLQKAAGLDDYTKARPILDKLEKELAERKGALIAETAAGLWRVILIQSREIAEYRGAYLTLGLHAYRAANGRWPAELKEGLAGGPAELLVDPFSGKPFAYKVQGETMTLYSVSEDGKDDGGTAFKKDGKATWGETGDYVFWPRE